jgi:hypothetical protein
MAVVMRLPFVARVVMLMGLQFNGLVLVDMPLLLPFMGMCMFMLVRMRVFMLMGVGMCVLIRPMLMGMLMFMLVPVLVFMSVVVFTFHLESPPFSIQIAASMQFLSRRRHHQFPVLDPLHAE